MDIRAGSAAVVLFLVATASANAGITRGVMGILGAEMT
jgi:hypothetical protein